MKAMDAEEQRCIHCGSPVPEGAGDSRFCCAGCGYVYDLLHSEGLERFYDLRGGQTLAPVPGQALRQRNYEWLIAGMHEAEEQAAEARIAKLQVAVQGLSCVGCVWLIEKVYQELPGAVRISLHPGRGMAVLEWEKGACDLVTFAGRLQQFGYLLGPADEAPRTDSLTPITRRVGLCGAFAMNAMFFSIPAYLGMPKDFMFAPWFDLVAACSATLALIIGGSYFAERSWAALGQGVLHIDTPITLGILASWLGSMVGWLWDIPGLKYFDFVGIFVFLMLAGRWLQQAAMERNRRRLLRGAAAPEEISVVSQEGKMAKLALHALSNGQTMMLAPGDVCPVSGVLASDQASLSLEWINGESEAAECQKGQAVSSGTLNIGTEPILVTTTEAWRDSLLHRLISSKESDCESSPFVAGLLRGYLAAVVIMGVAGALGWWWAGAGMARSLQVMISVFVVSCPCALGVAAPLADDLAATRMRRLGVFVRSSFLWQRLARVKKITFDKTGTLTMENPVLRNPEALHELAGDERAALGKLVSSNLHPISRSLFDAAGMMHDFSNEPMAPVEEVIGQGLRFCDERRHLYSLGRPGWRGGATPQGEGVGEATDAEFSKDGAVLASFRFDDALRPATRGALEELRRRGCGIYLLSGDRRAKVASIAAILGIREGDWRAELTPQEKAQWVAHMNAQDTLYVGDGANDSLALEEALCAGAPVTGRNFLEHKADFYFLGNSLRFLPGLLDMARRRQSAVRRVFGFGVFYNLGAVTLALMGVMSPLLAAILMPLSSVVTLTLADSAFTEKQGTLRPRRLAALARQAPWHGLPAALVRLRAHRGLQDRYEILVRRRSGIRYERTSVVHDARKRGGYEFKSVGQ